jgi:hypothetical protein
MSTLSSPSLWQVGILVGPVQMIKEVFQPLSMGPGYKGVVNITKPEELLMGYTVVCYLCRVVPVYAIQQCPIPVDCNLNFFLIKWLEVQSLSQWFPFYFWLLYI